MTTTLKAVIARFGRRLAVVAIALATTVTSLFAFSPAANAALSNCGWTPRRICVWEHDNFNGLQSDYYNLVAGGCYNIGSAMNDKTTSIANRTTSLVAYFYDDINCNGSLYPHVVYPGGTTANIVLVHPAMNDQISSFRVYNN